MGKFNEYTQKATPADNDTMMIYDAAAKANKLSPFSGIWNWIVGKLTNAVISNLQTSNKSVIGALNELNGGLPAGGIYDLDNPPKKMLFLARAGSTNFPNGFVGANAVAVIQMNLGNSDYNSMIAFTFVVDKIAIRRKSGTKNWSEWKYFNTAEILSNLTTTNKSSLVGAINELNSKTPSKNVNSLENYIKNAPIGVSFCDCQNADDNPFKGNMSICMTFNDDHSWGVQYLFVYKDIRYRTMSTGAVDEWKQIA